MTTRADSQARRLFLDGHGLSGPTCGPGKGPDPARAIGGLAAFPARAIGGLAAFPARAIGGLAAFPALVTPARASARHPRPPAQGASPAHPP